MAGEPLRYKNKKHIGPVKVTTLSLTDAVNIREEETLVVDITDLIAKGQVVAVLVDDQEYEYYLMKGFEGPVTLQNPIQDSWGNFFPAEGVDVKGDYYDRIKSSTLSYKFIKHKLTYIYAEVVRYICVEVNATTRINISDGLHEDILSASDI